ncbi:hypothetical protein [Funiculus sociatus]
MLKRLNSLGLYLARVGVAIAYLRFLSLRAWVVFANFQEIIFPM